MLTQETTAGKRKQFTESLVQEVTILERESERPWGWVVCCGAFVILFVTLGQHSCAGIVFAGLLAEYKSTRMETGIATQIASTTRGNICSLLYVESSDRVYLERFGLNLKRSNDSYGYPRKETPTIRRY